jgi:hypothetical protein
MNETEELKKVIDGLTDMLDKRSFLLGSLMGSLSGLLNNLEAQIFFTPNERIDNTYFYNHLKAIHLDCLKKINELFYKDNKQ